MVRHVRPLLFAALCLVPSTAGAQAGQQIARADGAGALLDQPAYLDIEDVSLVTALAELELRAGLALAYSPSLLAGKGLVSCACEDSTVAGALRALLADTGFTFREEGGQVVLLPGGTRSDALYTPERRVALASLTRASVPVRIEPATITGRVTSEGNLPLAGALVELRRHDASTVTSADGRFRIIILETDLRAGADTLAVSVIGYRDRLVPFTLAPGEIRLDVALDVDAVQLDELVVTGTAGNQMRAAQPAVIGRVDADAIVRRAPVSNVTQVLKNRVPGITITQGSGTSGASSRINIRGAASLSLSNEPLIFIDGVRMESQQRSLVAVGGQTLSALDDLNPADIDRIEVVKGPAAATLYGADASAGVIQIFTKRGRTGASSVVQHIALEYGQIEPNFTPYANYARCPEVLTTPGSGHPACEGETPGAVVVDNPLLRQDAFVDGQAKSLQYDIRGGGDRYGYYASFGISDEDGTTRNNTLDRRSGRVNFSWSATPSLSFNASMGLSRNDVRLPPGDQAGDGYMINAGLGSPLTLRMDDGAIAGGWLGGNQSVAAISSIISEVSTLRVTPSAQIEYEPFAWMTNRITFGADLNQSESLQMYPLNDRGWYSGDQANGWIERVRDDRDVYTIDYLGNVRTTFGADDRFTSDLSFGAQYIERQVRVLAATGIGLTTNSSNLIPGAATNSADEGFSHQKSVGVLLQEQVGFRDRLFLQVGARVDRNSAFGSETGAFFLPKVGASYVISEEPFWGSVRPFVSTLRLRAAYGTTGRSPTPGASLETYVSAPFIDLEGVLQPGLVPLNPGNEDLEPERGSELEVGFDAGLLDDRVGIELTFFQKRTTDLLIQVPQAPSSGFTQGGASRPYDNIGEVLNRGLEFAIHATPVSRPGFVLESRLQGTTLHNELVSLGDLEPFTSSYRSFTPGRQLGAWFVNRIRSVDAENGRVIVSDTAEFLGNQMPSFEGSFSTTLTLLGNLQLYAQLTGKSGYRIYNLGQEYRDRYFQNSAAAVLDESEGGYSDLERLRRYGPYYAETSGAQVPFTEVKEDYIQPGDHIRFSELSATYSLPQRLFGGIGVTSASVTLGARNLALWSKFNGFDPEVLGTGPGSAGSSFYDQFYIAEVFTTPPMRRWIARLNVQF